MHNGLTTSPVHTIDAAFSLSGDSLPVDHGYALYAALSRQSGIGPWVHQTDQAAIHPIRGSYVGAGLLKLNQHSRLLLRLPAPLLPRALALAGKTLDVDGHRLRVGAPTTTSLIPSVALYAHKVTTRNGQDENRFDTEIAKQLSAIGVRGKVTRGKRRVIRVKDKSVVAHCLLVTELTAEESICLQERGLGGRRKMGCGVFVPWRG